MKKGIAFLLALMLVLSLYGCGASKENAKATEDDESVQNGEVTETVTTELASAAEADPTDYSDSYNWIRCDYDNPETEDTEVDVLFFYGTCVNDPYYDDGSVLITDAMKTTVSSMGSAGAFDDGTRLYIPCYRQIALTVALGNDTHSGFVNQVKASLATEDVCAAMDYYFENYNDGRPFILAGYSQGALMTQIVLEEYFGQPENRAYLDRMVATYSIAFGVDKKLIEENDYLKFATCATDTGVIVSWNTEGPGEKETNILLADNPTDTLVINPINWKTDDTPAPAEESLGSLVDGNIVSPGVYNLQYDPERGSLICDNNPNYFAFPGVDTVVFGGKSLHGNEINQVYMDIRQNMHDRVEAFYAK